MAADKSMNVLVIDDYKTMVRIVRNLMDQLGFKNVDEAGDGKTALEMMQNKSYGLVLSDWNMQPMTGLQLLQEVRADARLRTTPFIMITAESKMENVVAATAMPISAVPVLPVNIALIKGFSVVGVRAGEYARRFPERGKAIRDAMLALSTFFPASVQCAARREALAALAAEIVRRREDIVAAIDADFGGWSAAQAAHFSEGGVFDQIIVKQ